MNALKLVAEIQADALAHADGIDGPRMAHILMRKAAEIVLEDCEDEQDRESAVDALAHYLMDEAQVKPRQVSESPVRGVDVNGMPVDPNHPWNRGG